MVWNIKSQESRLVYLTPREGWGGAGLLGVTIRLDNYAGAEDRLIRVLEVKPKSPAAIAGLVANQDFILGTTHQTLETVQDLADLLDDMMDQVIEFYVYNVDSDVVRVVALMPTLSWGGPGLLGAELGVGYLHRLPHASRNTQGASMTRKVRYVGTKNGPPPPPTSSGGGNTDLRPAHEVENEPQLEMEAHDSYEDESTSQNSSDVEEIAIPQRPATNGGVQEQQPEPPMERVPVLRSTSTDSSSDAAAAVFARAPIRTPSSSAAPTLSANNPMPPPPKMHY